jgi:hypothetical protein
LIFITVVTLAKFFVDFIQLFVVFII